MKLSLICSLLVLVACGNKRPAFVAGAEVSKQALSSDTSYELQGVDAEEVSCSTGLQTFKTLHEMCLDLQAPKEYECALLEKKALFAKKCEPAGYGYRESVKCNVQLLEASEGQGSDKILESHNICVGIQAGKLSKQNFKQVKGELAPGINYEMELTFKKSVTIEGEAKQVTTGFINVLDMSGEAPRETKLDYHANDVHRFVVSGDGRTIIYQSCQRSWGCE